MYRNIFKQKKCNLCTKVDKVKIEYIEDKDGYRALFKVDQGHRYKRGVISLKGDLIKDEKDLLDHISLDDSEYFSTRLLNEDIESLNTLYGDESYAFANIDPNIKKDEEQRIIHVEYGIEKGNKFIGKKRGLISANKDSSEKEVIDAAKKVENITKNLKDLLTLG